MFLDAGVPAVIASLWPVDDSQSSPFVEFHKHLRPTRDVARALRAAQMKELGDDPGRHPLRQWAGFAAFGGVNATWPGKDGSNDER
jgi:CHAT domain-containing protein